MLFNIDLISSLCTCRFCKHFIFESYEGDEYPVCNNPLSPFCGNYAPGDKKACEFYEEGVKNE